MHFIKNLLLFFFILHLISCYDGDKPLRLIYKEENDDQAEMINGMPSIDIVDGQELSMQLVTRGCFVSEDEPLIRIKKSGKVYLASHYQNQSIGLSNKVLDSSFKIHLKAFIYNCNKLSKKGMSGSIEFTFKNAEELVISDGLHITSVGINDSITNNPFRELLSAIYSHGQPQLTIK